MAGGSGTRLYRIAFRISKQFLPVYDKPMVYYPLSVLMLTAIRHILITTEIGFGRTLGDGEQFGINLSYAQLPRANRLGQVCVIGEDFFEKENVCLVLAGNILYG